MRSITTKYRNCIYAVSANDLSWLSSPSCQGEAPKQKKEWTTRCPSKDLWTCTIFYTARLQKPPGDNWVGSSVLHYPFKRSTLKRLSLSSFETASNPFDTYCPMYLPSFIPSLWAAKSQGSGAKPMRKGQPEDLTSWLCLCQYHLHTKGLRWDNGGQPLTRVKAARMSKGFFPKLGCKLWGKKSCISLGYDGVNGYWF